MAIVILVGHSEQGRREWERERLRHLTFLPPAPSRLKAWRCHPLSGMPFFFLQFLFFDSPCQVASVWSVQLTADRSLKASSEAIASSSRVLMIWCHGLWWFYNNNNYYYGLIRLTHWLIYWRHHRPPPQPLIRIWSGQSAVRVDG